MVSLAGNVETALAYAEEDGWAILPVWWIEPGGKCGCGRECPSPGKHPIGPLVPNGLKNASKDPEVIRRWWARFPQANIGVATGEASGVDVLDIDGALGFSALEALEAHNGEVPHTLRSSTGGGGQHRFFRHRPGLGNAVRVLPGVDVRTTGGYVVVPPSTHKSGRAYQWDDEALPGEAHPADWPEWLFGVLGKDKPDPQTNTNGKAVVGCGVVEGRRNDFLASRAGVLRRGGFSQHVIEAALRLENAERCHPPLGDAEVMAVARSIAKYDPGAVEVPADPSTYFYGIEELAELGGGDVDWILGDFLAPGEITGLVGREKEGKTTFLYAMLAQVERGEWFLGRPSRPASAVIASEEPAAIILERARRFRLSKARVLPRHSLHAIRTFKDRLLACVEEIERYGAQVLVLDSFAKVGGLGGEQENQSGPVQDLFNQVHEIIPAYVSTVVVHHASKGERTGTHVARGSTAWAGAVDTFLSFTKPRSGKPIRRIEWAGRHPEYPDPTSIELRQNCYSVVQAEVQDPPKLANACAGALGSQTMTKQDLMSATGGTEKQVRDAMSFLLAKGLVVVVNPGGGRGNHTTWARKVT